METTVKKILAYFEDNEEIFERCIEDLDSYNGYLGEDRYYEMDQLNGFYQGISPLDLLQRVYYGRDDDTWTTDASGNKIYGEFNPNREYFYYNGYGNLVSSDYKDYSSYLGESVIKEMQECRSWIDTIEENDDLKALFDEMEGE